MNTYPIATVADSDHADLAQDFVDVVNGDRGRRVIEGYGFGAP